MRESFLLRFASGGRPLPVQSFDSAEGVLFGLDTDASPLNLAVGLRTHQVGTQERLKRIRERRGWTGNQFQLDVAVDSGGLRFSGFQGDPRGLPGGEYELSVEVESLQFKQTTERLRIPNDGQAVLTFEEDPDPRQLDLADSFDDLTRAIVFHPDSHVDNLPLIDWLRDPTRRPSRRACCLNILAKLRVPPDPQREEFRDPLSSSLRSVFFADVDRIYAALDFGIAARLERLVQGGLWVKEGPPNAKIHQRLKMRLPRLGVPEPVAADFELASYRQGGRNSLQAVVAIPPADFADRTHYADLDIDLGNPLWDLEGLLVHASEVLDPGKTDHLALFSKLVDSPAKDFLYYTIRQAS